jgi:hypothetical protein
MTPLRSPYQALSPWESDEDIQIPNDITVHDADTFMTPDVPRGYRLIGVNAPEMYNPKKDTPRQFLGREATEAAADFLAQGTPDFNADYGRGYFGRPLSDAQVGDEYLNEYLVSNQLATPAYYGNTPQNIRERMNRSFMDAQLQYMNEPDHPVSQMIHNAPLRTPDSDFTPPEPRYINHGMVSNAVRRGIDQMQGNLYGGARTLTRLAESVTGADLSGVKNWAQEGADRNEAEAAMSPARFNSYKDVKGIGDWIPYAVEKAAESAPHMIPYLVGGGIGGVVGKTALGRVAGGVVGQAATRQAAKTVASDLVEKTAKDTLYKWGARAGATAAGAIGHAGEIENEMTQAGGYEVPAWQTLAASVARAGLDTFGMETVLSRVVGETAAKSAMDVAKNVAKGMGIGALAEGPTEAAQEAIAIGLRAVHDPNYDWQADAPDRLMESLIAGAAAGGLTSGVGSGAKATLDALGARGSSSDAGDSTKPKEPDPGAIQTITDEDVLWDPDYVRRAAMEGNFAEQAKRAPKGFEDPINRDGAEAMVAQGFNPGEISDIELVGRLKRMAGETSVEETRQFLKDNDIEVSDSILVKSGLKAKESKKVDEPTVKPYEFSFKDEDGVATTVEVTDLGEGKYAVSIGGLDPVEVEASSPGNAAAVSSGRPVTQVKSGTVKPAGSKGDTPESKGTDAATRLMERFKGAGDKADSIFYSEYSDEAIDQIYAGLDTNLSLDQRVAAKLDQVRTTRQALMDKVSTFDTMAEDEVKTELTKLSPEERAYVQGKTESKVLKDYIDAIQKVTETTPVNKYSDGVDETEVVERKAVKVNIGEKSTVYEAVKLKDGSYLIAAPDGTAVPISGLSPKEVRAFAKGINENAGGFASPWNDEKHGVDGVKIQRKGESKTDSSTEEPVPSEVYEDDIDSESGDKRVVQLMDNGVMRSFELVKLKDGKFATVKPDGGIVVLDKITPAAVNQALGVKKGAMARKWSESKDADMVPFPRKKREAKGKAESDAPNDIIATTAKNFSDIEGDIDPKEVAANIANVYGISTPEVDESDEYPEGHDDPDTLVFDRSGGTTYKPQLRSSILASNILKSYGVEGYLGDKSATDIDLRTVTMPRTVEGEYELINQTADVLGTMFQGSEFFISESEGKSYTQKGQLIAEFEEGIRYGLKHLNAKGELSTLGKHATPAKRLAIEVLRFNKVKSPARSGVEQVSIDNALKQDPVARVILGRMAKAGAMLTGSAALGPQGTIKRPSENLLHDIDFVAPEGVSNSIEGISALIRKAFPYAKSIPLFNTIGSTGEDLSNLDRQISRMEKALGTLSKENNIFLQRIRKEDEAKLASLRAERQKLQATSLSGEGRATAYSFFVPIPGFTVNEVSSTTDARTFEVRDSSGTLVGLINKSPFITPQFFDARNRRIPEQDSKVRAVDIFHDPGRVSQIASTSVGDIAVASFDEIFRAKRSFVLGREIRNPVETRVKFKRAKDSIDFLNFMPVSENRGDGERLFDKTSGKDLAWYKDGKLVLAAEVRRALRSSDIVTKALALETVAHEIGHHAVIAHLGNASAAVREQVDKDYEAYLTAVEFKSPQEIAAARMTILRSIRALGDESLRRRYALSKEEWLADEAAKFLLRPEEVSKWSPETQSLIRKIAQFLQKLITQFQRMYRPEGKGIEMFFRELEAAKQEAAKVKAKQQQRDTTGSEAKDTKGTTTSPQVVEGKWQKPEAKDTKYAEIRRPVFSEPTYAINTWEIGSKLAKDMPVADDAVIQELNKKQDFYKYTVISEDMANRVRTYLNWYVLTTGYKISDIELAAFELTDNSPVNAVALQYQYMSNGKRKIVISLRTDQHDKERGRVISRYNVVHELGHAVDMMRSAKVNYGISSSGKFRALLPLIVHDITTFMEGTVYNNPDYKGKTFVEVHPLKQIIAQGANTDVDYGSREVFAEIFALYFTNPGLLYEISPRSHKFIRSIVGVSPVATDRMSVSAGAIRRGAPIDLGNGTRNSKNSSTAGKRASDGGRAEAVDSISEDEQEIKDDTQTSKMDERSTTDAPSEDGAEQRTAREIKVRYDVTPTGKEYKDLRRAKEALEALEQDAINEEISRLEAEREALKNEKKSRDLTPEEESWIDRLSKIKLKWDGTKLQYELDGKVLSPEEHLKFIEQRKRFYTLEPQKNGTYTVNAYELRFDAPDPISEAKIEQYIEGAFKEVNDGKQTRTAKESTMEIITPDGKTRRISAPKITLLGAILNGWVSVSKGGFRTVHESFSRGLAELIRRGYSLPPMKGGQKLADNSAKNKALQAKFNGLPPDLVVFSLRKGFKVRVKNLGWSKGGEKARGYASEDITRIDELLGGAISFRGLGGTYTVRDIESKLEPILEGVEELDPFFTAFQLEGLPDNEVDTLIAQLKGKKDKALVRKVDEILLEARTRRLDSVGDVDWESLRNEVDPDGWLNELFDDKEEYAEGVSDTERIAEQQVKEERPEGDPMAGHKRGTPTGIKPYGQDKPRSKLESLFDSVAEKIGLRTTFHVFQDKATLIKAMKSYIPYAPKTEVGKLEEAIKWVESEGDSEPLVIYNDWFSNWALRTPFIYVPANMSDAEAIRATAHEFGHIVKHAMLDGIIERARAGDKQAREVAEFLIPDQLLKEVLKVKNWRTSRENYIIDELMAINMERWISSNATPTNAVERFFKGMVDLMRGMIREIQRKAEELLQKSNVNRSKAVARQSYVNFNEFMSAMVGGNLNIYAGNLEEATDPIFRQLRDLKRKLATINANSAESARLTSRIEALQKRIDKGKPNFNLGSAVSELGKLSRDLEAEKSRAQNYDRTGSEPNAYRKQLDVRIKNLESQINDLQAKVDGARAVSAEAVSTNDRITETLKSELDKLKTRLRKTKSKESSDVFGALALLNREAIALLQGRGVTYKPTPSKAVESQVSYHLGLLQEIADNLTAPSPMSSIPVRDLFTTGQVLPHVADGRVGARFNGEDLYQSAKSYARQATGKVKTNKYSGPVASWISSLGDELNILSPVVRTIRSELDHMDGITAQFIKQAFQAIPSEILIEEAQWLPKLSAMLEGLPKPSGKWVRTGDQKALDEQRKSKYGQIGEHLNKATPLSQIKDGEVRKGVKAVRDFLHEFMFDETNGLNDKYSLNIQKRERYFTGVLNLDRWRGGRDEIVPILAKTMNISTKQAAKLWLEIGDRTDGILLDVDPAVMDHVLAPSLSAKYARFFTPETKAALWEYYESDIHAVTSSYVRSAIRRGIMQQHFGMYDMDAKAGKFILDPKTNKRVYNPMGKLDYFLNIERILHDKSRKEGLSHAEVDRIRGVLLPALMGRLGANHVTPKLRSFMSWTKTYFNISLLPLATLSSLPELGGIKMKLMEDPRYTKNMGLMRATLEKFKDPELTRLAGVIGVIQKDIVEHALSGDAHNGYMVPGAQKVNNAFFRAVQMKRWADFTRVVAMRLAHNAFQEAARAGDGTYLGQYGIKVSDVSGLGTANQAYKMALHKWVDEAVLRPGALHRPAWGSDARKQLLWYLMDYMWLFYEVTMQVTGKAMANRRGIARVLPLVALASIMLPLAALGYELRKLITQDMMADLIGSDYKPKELDELAYLWEITQRSGFLGPAQKLVDYDEATNRNKSAVINALGPIAEASVLLLDEGLDEFLIRYSPGMASSSPLRRQYGPAIRDALTFSDE